MRSSSTAATADHAICTISIANDPFTLLTALSMDTMYL